MHNTYSDPHNYGRPSDYAKACGSSQVATSGYLNVPNQQIYKPEIDYAKLVDELLKRIRQDAGYRYELPGYPKGPSYDYVYQHLPDEANKTKPYWYPYSAISQANNENQNISYSKGNGQVDTAHSEWMM